jgi:hypothetical protein
VRFTTYSGSQYEIEGHRIRRVNHEAAKRGDEEWQELVNRPHIEVGQSAILTMISLSRYGSDDYGTPIEDVSPYTTRITSTVTEIEND